MSGWGDSMAAAFDALRAENAELRVRLQKAHGALSVFRHPEDGGHKPRAQWRLNPFAARDFGERYNLAELLEETRPDAEMGLELLVELRELREAAERQPALAAPSEATTSGEVVVAIGGKVLARVDAPANKSNDQIAKELLTALAGSEVADPYGLDQLRAFERKLREESANAARERDEHRQAATGVGGIRRTIILGRHALAECRAARTRQWADTVSNLVDKAEDEAEAAR